MTPILWRFQSILQLGSTCFRSEFHYFNCFHFRKLFRPDSRDYWPITSITLSTMPRRSTKRKSSENAADAPQPKLKKQGSNREPIPELKSGDFETEAKTKDGRKWSLKLSSWNVNGIRAWMEKNGQSYLETEKPDVLCIQETKCSQSKIPDACKKVDGYHTFWSSAEKEGYAGTGLYSKTKPISVTYGLGKKEHDEEGRTITAEFEHFYLVSTYVPNSGRGLVRLDYRIKNWDKDLFAHLKELDKKKPVIWTGDLNVAHKEIDLKNPKTNHKTAGFTPQERESFGAFLDDGFVDSFREFYPDKTDQFSFWSYMGGSRGKNVGWRLDYFIVSKRLMSDVCDSLIRPAVMGSDHCPIVLLLAPGGKKAN